MLLGMAGSLGVGLGVLLLATGLIVGGGWVLVLVWLLVGQFGL